MADQSDVENALAALVANSLYPEGSDAPSVIGMTCRVYRGYPTAPALDADLAKNVLHVSVAATDLAGQNVTRYPRKWVSVAPVPATLNVVVTERSAAFSGLCALGQLAGVMINETLFSYAVQGNDSAATVASNLAALLRSAGWIVQYSGQTITVPGAERFVARVVSGAGALQEIRRQIQQFKISLWCPDPASRDIAAPVIDQALSNLNFMPLADGSYAWTKFTGSTAQDSAADATLYRRDLIYSVEYPTTRAQITPAMLFGSAGITANSIFLETLQG
jgi:hypothetical protein